MDILDKQARKTVISQARVPVGIVPRSPIFNIVNKTPTASGIGL